jgi:hypothetical protein|tara:strand:+ start:116 stop:661 length:546 start_codon:yes stop_codon:yes gene_type:complete
MAKTIKTSKLDKASTSARTAAGSTHTVSAGKIVKKGSPDKNLYEMYSKLRKNGAIGKSNPMDTTQVAEECLSALGIRVKTNPNPYKSLLSEEDSSNKITNVNIVDLKAYGKLERVTVLPIDKFPYKDDPWYQLDEDKSEYVKKQLSEAKKKITPNRSALAAAIYGNSQSKNMKGKKLSQLK